MKRALITGITGQDGSYLAELLLTKGYDVYGLTRRTSTVNNERIAHIQEKIHLLQGDLLDQSSLASALSEAQPEEVYNLAAQSFVKTSWNQPVLTGEFTAIGVTRMLEAIRTVNPKIKFYQASSSEMFGKVTETPQKETTRFYPRSPYGVAKVYGHYNSVARISLGKQKKLELGNLDSERDWGFAGDYVEAMWRMLQQQEADDYVIATGEKHSVREFVDLAFQAAGIADWEQYVESDKPEFLRPAEVDYLIGDYSKAKKVLAWTPKTSFKELVTMMVEADLSLEKGKEK
jgi:GDPmannose 4,6-dehydratase